MIITQNLQRIRLVIVIIFCTLWSLTGCISTGTPPVIKKQEPTKAVGTESTKIGPPLQISSKTAPQPADQNPNIKSRSPVLPSEPSAPEPNKQPNNSDSTKIATATENKNQTSKKEEPKPDNAGKSSPSSPSSEISPSGVTSESRSIVPAVKPKKLPIDETAKLSNQELLDAALEYFQASDDLWEQGDLDGALETLDKAYTFILKVNKSDDPQVAQQKEDLRITIAKRITEVYASRFTVANGNHKAIPLVMNKYVENALNIYKGPGRNNFLTAYRLSGRYRPAIVKALEQAGLPTELSWLPLVESEFKIRAFSTARAFGLWQFIASTGYLYGLKRDTWVDERMDPDKSTAAAIAYLQELHKIFGDWSTALAAYNCGEYLVLNRIKNQRMNYLDNFWDLYEQLPRETTYYVPKFLAVLHIINDPQAYGFTLPPVDDEIQAEDVTINKKMQLSDAAKHLGIDADLLKDLNAELRYGITPEKPYILKVPKGLGELLLAKLNEIPVYEPPVPPYFVYTIRRGDTLSTIARQFRISQSGLMDANDLRKNQYLRIGQHLRIPSGRYAPSTAKTNYSPPVSNALVRYVVQEGDSLWTIANHYNTTVDSIRSLNKLKDKNLKMGQEILISPNHMAGSHSSDAKTYVVQEGETLYSIAKKHQMNLTEFLSLNNLNTSSTIYPGQTVKVKTD
jgi:membrane-bound lytic murein transglycosylase D